MSAQRRTASMPSPQDAFREGYFHRGKANPYPKPHMLWQAWEVGKHFQKQGLGFFNIRKHQFNDGFHVEDGRTVYVLVTKGSDHRIQVWDRPDREFFPTEQRILT